MCILTWPHVRTGGVDVELHELLEAESIVIQCHNAPDADAIGSGFGVYRYLASKGKKVRLVYGGGEPIRKRNLTLMVELLDIPIEHVESFSETPDLLLTVDCQPGERNVQPLCGRRMAAIDHHTLRREGLKKLWKYDVRESCGACATVVWDMLRRERDFDLYGDRALVTALYYGLFMDTCKLQEISSLTDRAARDALEGRCLEEPLRQFRTHNLSLRELLLVGGALGKAECLEKYRVGLAQAAPCDQNVLGIISDQLLEVDELDVCVVYAMTPRGARLSIRSCMPQIRADELASSIAGGGGHRDKAGGLLSIDRLGPSDGPWEALGNQAGELIKKLIGDFFDDLDLVNAGGENAPDLSDAPLYRKKPLELGYILPAEIYRPGSRIKLLMPEGDEVKEVDDALVLMVGADFEVYPNTREYFERHNVWSDELLPLTPEELQRVEDAVSGVDVETVPLAGRIRRRVPVESFIRARRLERTTMVVTLNGECLRGAPGDYLAAGLDSPADLYIIKSSLLDRTYEPA